MSSTPVLTSSTSQRRWRAHMKHNYSVNHDFRPCVFQVPDNLKETKPEAYTPQLLGLGPYHHFRPQVQHMEREKRAAVLGFFKLIGLKNFVDFPKICPKDFQPIIRSCYDRYMDLDKETLAWVVIVDGIYLWYLMGEYHFSKEQGRNKALYAELFMLENQIPIVVIQESFKFIRKSVSHRKDINHDKDDEQLYFSYRDFCKEISPLRLAKNERLSRKAYDKKKHLLHYMYQMIVIDEMGLGLRVFYYDSVDEDIIRASADEVAAEDVRDDEEDEQPQENRLPTLGDWVRQFARAAASKGRKMGHRVRRFTRAAASRVREMGDRVRGIATEAASQGREITMETIKEFNSALSDAKSAGIKVSENVHTVSNILRNFEKVLDLHHKKLTLGDDQIGIPSASRLKAILKITFKARPDWCGMGDISLEGKILSLPVITLRPSSEVILRNLAAYEEIAKMELTPIRAYLELMGGLIKSEKDVKLLRDAGIIKGEQLPDKEIVRMCNGFKKSDKRPVEESNNHVQSTVEQVKNQFGKVGIVKACRSIMKGFAGFVKFVKPLFQVLVLLFLDFQSFCEIYDCRRRGSSSGGAALHGELDPKARLMLPRKVFRY